MHKNQGIFGVGYTLYPTRAANHTMEEGTKIKNASAKSDGSC